MTFSEDAWRAIAPIYRAILAHPFNRALADGSLAEDRFNHYMAQDAIYLVGFSRALAIIAARAPGVDAMAQFSESASRVLTVERALHREILERYDVPDTALESLEPSPTCLSYTNFLIATAYQAPCEVAISAVLPCFWIYRETGQHIARIAAPENPFREWIDSYSDPAYDAAVTAAIATTDRVARDVSARLRGDMLNAFRRAAELEWMFWDAAWRVEAWPFDNEETFRDAEDRT